MRYLVFVDWRPPMGELGSIYRQHEYGVKESQSVVV